MRAQWLAVVCVTLFGFFSVSASLAEVDLATPGTPAQVSVIKEAKELASKLDSKMREYRQMGGTIRTRSQPLQVKSADVETLGDGLEGPVAKAAAATAAATAAVAKTKKKATGGADEGATARCKQVNPGTQAGVLDCIPAEDRCSVKGFLKGKEACAQAWGGKVSCPDGISSQGVFLTWLCAKWSSTTVTMGMQVDNTKSLGRKHQPGPGVVITKALVLHVHSMSKNSGVLLLKRLVCKKNKCAVYKSGLCVDVGKKVWSSILNGAIKDMKAERAKFAIEAEKLLAAHNNKLPIQHLCSNKRHKSFSGRNLLDQDLGKSAVMLF